MKSFELLLTILFISIIYLIIHDQQDLCIIGICSLLFMTVLFSNNIKGDSIKGCSINEGLQTKTNSVQDIDSTQGLDSNQSVKPNINGDLKPIQDTTQPNIDDIIKNKVLNAHSQSKNLPKATENTNKPTKEKTPNLKPISERPKQLEYSENNYKYNLFDEIGSLGDNKLAHLQKHISNKNRVAIDNMARQNKYTNINYFAEELNDHVNSVWWDDETLEKEF